jgi:hypothetical protein
MNAGKGMSGLTAAPARRANDALGSFRARHLRPRAHKVPTGGGVSAVLVDEAESPLAWLARRQGRNGRALIAPHQFLAGERLRADFTRAQMMPRTTSNWDNPVAPDRSGPSGVTFSDVSLAARQRVRHALHSAGPEFSGLLLDVCCFLKRLEDIERERVWPARSAKVVLQLALDRLARHYGLSAEAVGKSRGDVRTWLASDAEFWVDCV